MTVKTTLIETLASQLEFEKLDEALDRKLITETEFLLLTDRVAKNLALQGAKEPAMPPESQPSQREIRNVRNKEGAIVGCVESLADGRFRASWSVSGTWGSAVLNSLSLATQKIRVEIRRSSPAVTNAAERPTETTTPMAAD